MSTLTLLSVALLADGTPTQTGPDFGKASPFGLLVIVLLLVGTFFLGWSMNKHLRKLPASFDEKPALEDDPAPAEASDETADDVTTSDAPADTDRNPGGQPTG